MDTGSKEGQRRWPPFVVSLSNHPAIARSTLALYAVPGTARLLAADPHPPESAV